MTEKEKALYEAMYKTARNVCQIKRFLKHFDYIEDALYEMKRITDEFSDGLGDFFDFMEDPEESKDTPCYVYYLLNEPSDKVKIGISSYPDQRAKQLQTAAGEAIDILHTIKFKDRQTAINMERFLHQKFSRKRKKSRLTKTVEWFDADIIEDLKSQYWTADQIIKAEETDRLYIAEQFKKMEGKFKIC